MAAHWSFGPVLQPYSVTGSGVHPTPDVRADLIPFLITSDARQRPDGIVFHFPSFDPAVTQAPTETRVYFAPSGDTQPSNPDEFIARGHAYSASTAPIGPDGAPDYVVPHPTDLPDGDYIGRTLCYFPE